MSRKHVSQIGVGDRIVFNFGITRAVTDIRPAGRCSVRLFFGDLNRVFRLQRLVDVEA